MTKVATWAVYWKMFKKAPRKEFFTTESKALAFYKKLWPRSPEEQSVRELPWPLVLGAVRCIGGLRFRSDGYGHWYSEDGIFVVQEMLLMGRMIWGAFRRGNLDDYEELVGTRSKMAGFKKQFCGEGKNRG